MTETLSEKVQRHQGYAWLFFMVFMTYESFYDFSQMASRLILIGFILIFLASVYYQYKKGVIKNQMNLFPALLFLSFVILRLLNNIFQFEYRTQTIATLILLVPALGIILLKYKKGKLSKHAWIAFWILFLAIIGLGAYHYVNSPII